jgi:hypothetical protein
MARGQVFIQSNLSISNSNAFTFAVMDKDFCLHFTVRFQYTCLGISVFIVVVDLFFYLLPSN